MEEEPQHTAAELRLLKDIRELDLPACIAHEQQDSLYIHRLQVRPLEGPYAGGSFPFQLTFKPTYPFEPPRARLLRRIFHPNIDVSGHVCLNVLRLEWSPVLGLNVIALGLLQLFLEPSAEEPLNQEAGELLARDPAAFADTVRKTMCGESIGQVSYDNVMI